MLQIISLSHTLDPRGGAKSSFFRVVMLLIKLTELKHRTQCKQIFCHFTQPRPLDWVKGSKHFSEGGHVANQIKRKEL